MPADDNQNNKLINYHDNQDDLEKKSLELQNAKKSLVPFEEISLPDRLLSMAGTDLDASILLYENGYYPQAVFLLQQSVEKTCKSPGIFFKIITEKDSSKYIGHKSLRIVKKTTDDFTNSVRTTCQILTDNPDSIPSLKHLDIDYAKTMLQIDLQMKNVYEYLESLDQYDLTDEQINMILAELKQQTDIAEKSLKKLTTEGISDNEYSDMANSLYEMLRSFVISMKIPEGHKSILIGLLPITMSQILPKKKQLVYLIQMILTILVCSITLFHLARITAPHAVCSRYPNTKDSFDPLEYYSKDCPLVVNMPEIFRYTQIAIERVDLLYDIILAGDPISDNIELSNNSE
jgi:HEPN domain-containing protein